MIPQETLAGMIGRALSTGAEYADVGERTYRDWFKKGLRSVRVKGIVLTKVEWIDEFLEAHEKMKHDDRVDSIVNEIMEKIN